MPKFSVVMCVYSEFTPQLEGQSGHLHNRSKMVQRAIKSVIAQQYTDWELIIVDDGCVDEVTPRVLDKFAKSDKRIKVFHKNNENRAVGFNYGTERATGEWICYLDSDDEYSTNYLRVLDQATKEFPEYKIFNFGAIVHWPDYKTTIRHTFYPNTEGSGHEWFRSGHIGMGSFIFERKLWSDNQDKYRIPDEVNPYQFAAASKFDLRLDPVADQFQYENSENPEGAFTDGVYRHGLSLGNPWGNDFFQFYLLTRDNYSKPLDVLLYVQYPRAHEEVYEHFGEIYDVD